MPTDGGGHDLAEDGLVRSRTDMPTLGENRQAQQHDTQDHPEQELGSLCPNHPGLLEQGDTIGDRLNTSERATTGGERLQHQQHTYRLQPVGSQQGVTGLGRIQRQGMDQPDGDDDEQANDAVSYTHLTLPTIYSV